MGVKERIRGFITSELAHDGPDASLGDDESLLERGILDSLGLLRVLGFLEQEYQVTINDDEVIPENFQSINAIAAFVEKRRSGTSAR